VYTTQWNPIKTASAVAWATLAIVLFAGAMTSGIGYDEEQYVAAAYFARHLHLYRDFISFQPPPYTWLLAAAFDVVNGWYLLTARVITSILALGSCALLFSLLRSLGTSRVAAFALVATFVASPYSHVPFVMARNDVMPLFLLLASLRLFIAAEGDVSSDPFRLGFSGFLAGLALSTKYSYLFVAPILFATLIVQALRGRHPNSSWRQSLPAFACGAVVGVAPLIYALAAIGNQFVFLTLTFHTTAIVQWYESQGLGRLLTLDYKLKELARTALRDGNVVLLTIFAVSMATVLVKSGRSLVRSWPSPTTLTLLALFGGSLAIALVIGPHPMYYFPAVAMGTLLAGRAYAVARTTMPGAIVGVLIIVGLIQLRFALTDYTSTVLTSANIGAWAGVQVHRTAQRLASMLEDEGISGHVATLFPIVVLDENPVRANLAAGPFFFRSADLYPPSRVAELNGVGPKTLESVLSNDPPAAILADFGDFPFKWNPPMDEALTSYAERHRYHLAATDWSAGGYKHIHVWLRPN
jgi:hypothetical protein